MIKKALLLPMLYSAVLFLFSAAGAEADSPRVAAGGRGKPLVLPPLVESPGTGSFYCGGRIISVGMTMEEVAELCGEPTWQERIYDDIGAHPSGGQDLSAAYVIDEWIYDFGARRLLRLLRFRDGSLIGIRTGSYGYGGRPSPSTCESGRGFRLGATKMEIFFECGAPDAPSTEGEYASDPAGSGAFVESDQWTYNFGPDRLTYHLTFRRGRLADVKTGRYGHEEPP